MAKLSCDMIYINDNCLNSKRATANPCRLCIDVCPHRAISESKKISSDLCTECGLCMSVCPSDGFIHRMSDELFEYLTLSDRVILNCPQSVSKDFEISCLGIFDQDSWGTLLILAKEKPVIIYTGNCAECLDKNACEKSVKTLIEVYSDQLSDTSLSIKVIPDSENQNELLDDPTANYNKNELSDLPRRKTFNGWLKNNKKKLETLMPSLISTKGYLIPKSREKLIQLLRERVDIKIPFRALTVSNQCTSCGVCSMICPQNALQKRENGGTLKLVFEPYKCVHCNRCINSCPAKSISYHLKQLSYKYFTGKILLYEGNVQHCKRCGKQLFQNNEHSLCIACASNDSTEDNSFLL